MTKELERITDEAYKTYTIAGHEQIEFFWKGLDMIREFINECESSDKVNSNFALGSLYAAFKEGTSAANSFEKFLKYAEEEQKGELLYKIGTVLLLEQFPLLAVHYLNKSLSNIKDDDKLKVKALVNLGAAYEDLAIEKKKFLISKGSQSIYESIAEARKNYNKALKINPNDEKAKFNLNRLNNKGLANEKEDNWLFSSDEKIKEIDTLEKEVNKCYNNSGVFASTKKAVEEVLGTLYLLASKHEKAEKHFQTALSNSTNKALTSYNIGTAYSIVDKIDKARAYLFESLRNKPDKTIRIKVLNGLSSIYIQKGKIETAERIINNVLRLNPNDEKALFNLREIEKGKGTYKARRDLPARLPKDGILKAIISLNRLSPQGPPHSTNKSIVPYLSNRG